jgi:UDP-N-acetylmuramoyl-L-alanyl-D-glutamate--2,6-diaminopimelate ligase
VRLSLAGRFNVTNALAAATTAEVLGIAPAVVAEGLSGAAAVPGRFELVPGPQPFSVFVDYAHTPDAVAIATSTARELAGSGMVIVVVGAGGDRDPHKRPEMGRAAADGADIVVVTSDNPRGEDPRAIADAVAAGVGPSAMIILDRRAAIAAALDRAGVGDVVLVAGKGHETTQTVGDEIVPFDDRQVVAELLVERGW